MSRIIIIGGGWSGCAAALSAKKASIKEVIIIEKTDILLGAGNVGGIFRNNGRFTAAEEMIALGGGEFFNIMDDCALHRNIAFPGHHHASLYAVNRIEPKVRKLLIDYGIKLYFENGVSEVDVSNAQLNAVILSNGKRITGDVFIETTGSSGPMGNCLRYGHGCAMCIQRCPSYGPRISISARCGVPDLIGERANGTPGVFSGSCKLAKESLSVEVREKLDRDGVVILKVPTEDINYEKLNAKACKQYALKEFSENVILLDTGHAKLMTSYYPLEKLRKIAGLEYARFIDPYAGGKGNSIRFLSMAPRSNELQVDGIKNLFCGGEKSGPFIGHTEAIVTGTLAGYNAACQQFGHSLLTLPESLATGDLIAYANLQFKEEKKKGERYTFAGGTFFERMQTRGTYSTDPNEITKRITAIGLDGVFKRGIG